MVRGTSYPAHFASFPSLDALLSWMGNQYGRRDEEQHTSQVPISENDPIYVYELDPDVKTLVSSTEFQKLNEKLKAKVFQGLEFTKAFAKFILDGGRFVIDSTASMATYHATEPPHIKLQGWNINPGDYAVNAMVFVIAHEIYHHVYKWSGVLDRDAWARNEAIASLMAYKVANRIGITSVEGGQGDVAVVFSLAAGAISDDEAMSKLIGCYGMKYPGVI